MEVTISPGSRIKLLLECSLSSNPEPNSEQTHSLTRAGFSLSAELDVGFLLGKGWALQASFSFPTLPPEKSAQLPWRGRKGWENAANSASCTWKSNLKNGD